MVARSNRVVRSNGLPHQKASAPLSVAEALRFDCQFDCQTQNPCEPAFRIVKGFLAPRAVLPPACPAVATRLLAQVIARARPTVNLG